MPRGSRLPFLFMYALYLDESGNESDPSDRHFVLAGVAVFERQIHFLTEAVDEMQNRFPPGYEPIPMHASPMRKGKSLRSVIDPHLTLFTLGIVQGVIASVSETVRGDGRHA